MISSRWYAGASIEFETNKGRVISFHPYLATRFKELMIFILLMSNDHQAKGQGGDDKGKCRTRDHHAEDQVKQAFHAEDQVHRHAEDQVALPC